MEERYRVLGSVSKGLESLGKLGKNPAFETEPSSKLSLSSFGSLLKEKTVPR